MKYASRTIKIKFTVAAIAASVALLITALFSILFGFDGHTSVGETSAHGVRFVQVAAGEDFAIGLTSDGDLYGWSLKPNKNASGDETALTLGEYYTNTPTKIPVTFYVGMGEGDEEYYSELKDDYIVQITATRKTAAFITSKNRIYTWGRDGFGDNDSNNIGYHDVRYTSGSLFGSTPDSSHNLLLRNPTDTHPWYSPCIIYYDYYAGAGDNLFGLSFIKPDGMSKLTIAGGEYNYIIVFIKDSQYYSYVWGSAMYAVNQRQPVASYNFIGDVEALQGQFKTLQIGKSDNTFTAVAGGYTVGYNSTGSISGGTSLSVRGKNFITSQSATKDSTTNTYTITQTIEPTEATAVASVYYNADGTSRVTNALIGAAEWGGFVDGSSNAVVKNSSDDKYFARQKAVEGLGTYNLPSSTLGTAVYSSTGDKLGYTSDTPDTDKDPEFKAIHNAVSLGNDIGYGISGGALYAWGDNSVGQLCCENTVTNSANPKPVLSDKNFATVAAGKQLSGENKPFNMAETLDTDGSFKDAVKNSENFISGAVTTDGDLYVWSTGKYSATQIHYGNKATKNNNQFIAVYSGYGNNIFAITKLGRVVRVEADGTSYKQTVYDKFNDGTGDITNWEITDQTNKAQFTVVATPDDHEPDLGSLTFFANNGLASRSSIKLNGNASAEGSEVVNYIGNSLIKSNACDDVYRILDPSIDGSDATNGGIDFTATTATGGRANELDRATLTPKFFRGEIEMRPAERENLFDYEFVYNKDYGVGIKITPKHATKGEIKMTFVVARYDSTANFTISETGTTPTDNAVYYDYAPCSIVFSVDNTPSYVTFVDFAGVIEGDGATKPNGNSLIPLLDPNNAYNNQYSIAVQDVTGGARALAEYLSASKKSNIYDAILAEMKKKDSGFPDSAKIEKGNLEYYLGKDTSGTLHNRNNASDKYNDEYQFLFTDRDTDLLLFDRTTPVRISSSAVEGKPNSITVSIPLKSGSSYDIAEDKITNVSTDFMNVYGLYDIKVEEKAVAEGGATEKYLSFSYNTILFTAKGRTGNIQYGEQNPENPDYRANIVSYNTTNTSNAWARTHVRLGEYTGNTANYNPERVDTTGLKAEPYSEIVSVFSQPSLRLSSKKMTTDSESVIYGDASTGKNKYTLTEEYINGKIFCVGKTSVINLSEFLDCVDSNSIYFSYADQHGDYTGFNNQFRDELDSTKNVVTLGSNQISITPTTTRPIYFTFYIQRFDSRNKPFDSGNEKIEITVNIPNIADFELAKSNATTSFQISQPAVIDILGKPNNASAYNEGSLLEDIAPNIHQDSITQSIVATYKTQIKISQIISTNNAVATAAVVAGSTTAITVTPGTSGKATIMFVVSLYGKSLPMQLSFTVAGVTPVAGTIELNDVKSLYVSNLLADIRKQNSFVDGVNESYNVLPNDVNPDTGIPNAIYFVDADGVPVDGLPRFIQNVRFTDTDTENPRIRVEINDNIVDNVTEEYYMRVRFVDLRLGLNTYEEYVGKYPILQSSQKIISTKSVVMGGADGTDVNNPYVVNIDCDTTKPQGDNTNSDWYTVGEKNDMKVRVPIRMLLKLIGEENPQEFAVALVRSDSTTTNYMYYSSDDTKQYIDIIPLYNTPVDENGIADPVVITVSVTPKDAASTRTNRILAFRVTIKGISTTLDKKTYTTIWLVAFFSSLGLLLIIMLIRMIVYWHKRAKQRSIAKRNQELIRMRDRIHNKTTAATREQMVKTKLKMNDPKYARLLGEIKRDRADAANTSGVVLENADLTELPDIDDKGKKKKKKKNGKKSIAELKAELEAKKAAVLAAQNGGMGSFGGGMPLDAQPFGMPDGGYVPPDGGFVSPDQGFGGADPGFGSPADSYNAGDLGSDIIFDTPDDGMQG